MKICEIENCEAIVKAKGLCSLHYGRMHKWGTTEVPDELKPREGCEVDGCDKPHNAKGYCNLHYQRSRRGVPLDPPKRSNLCTWKDCVKPFYAKGLCQRHYNRQLHGVDMDGRRKPPDPCKLEGCGKDAVSKGYCPTHYHQLWWGVEPYPVGPRLPMHDWKENTHRECTECHESKPYSDFYQRTQLPNARERGYFSKCKRCVIAMQQVRKWKRGKIAYPENAIEYLKSIGSEVDM